MFSFNPCSVIKLGQTGVYLVDNLNSAEGLPCTCTIYWLYRNVQVTERGLSEYVPKCATNQSMIRDELDKCADLLGNPVETHCRRTSSGNHELTTIATSGLTFSGTTEQKLTEKENIQVHDSVSIVLSVVLGVVCVACVGLSVGLAFFFYRYRETVGIRVTPI